MAIGWLSVLQMVPWSDLISNAPKVADSAKKLWQVVGKNRPTVNADVVEASSAHSTESEAINLLQVQLTAAEAAISDLHGQMLASSELIKALADQNTQLIQRVEVNRIRFLWLSAVTVVLVFVVIANMILTFAR
jgi:amino acid transporter